MAKRIPIDKLTDEIEGILKKYGDDTARNLTEIVKEMSKKGAQTVKAQAQSSFGGTGRYAKGWTSQTETNRVSAQGIIYNQDLPGLPHLLEHGHANRGGGRTPGRIHIANVEEQLVKEFEQKVKAKL